MGVNSSFVRVSVLKKVMPVVGWVIFWSGMMYVGYDYLSVLAAVCNRVLGLELFEDEVS
jgi:hypothetical protein